MPNTNSWLCLYAIAQLGRPYWYGTQGQISTMSLYSGTVIPALKDAGLDYYTNANKQLGVKVHDCAGLVAGALMCDDVDKGPVRKSPIIAGATSIFNGACLNKDNKLSNFPKTPGTLVFISNGNKKRHVGIYIGNLIDKNGKQSTDIVVEAKGHTYGVVASRLYGGSWDSWGQLSICTADVAEGTVFDARNLTYSNSVNSTVIDGQSLIDIKNMNPYIATILPGYSTSVDYVKLKAAKVSGVMFFGGELYDAAYRKKSTYVNPQLNDLVNKCNSSGMPYALYVNIKSRNEIEADEECRTLYYIISRYSPKFGLWLSIQTPISNVSINNKILEVYYKYINKWGLSARCGLYVTKSQLAKITWDSFKDRFYLWLREPLQVSEVSDKLLQPEMFEVPD